MDGQDDESSFVIGGVDFNNIINNRPGVVSLYNQLMMNRATEQKTDNSTEEGTSATTDKPSLELDDPRLIERIEDARSQLKKLDQQLSIVNAQALFADASTQMSQVNDIIRSTKNCIAMHEGKLNTFGEDLSMLTNNKLPAGYEGNLRQCLGKLRSNIIGEAVESGDINKLITEISKRIEFMFFKFSTIYTGLTQRIEIYEKTIGDVDKLIKDSKPKDDFNLDTELEPDSPSPKQDTDEPATIDFQFTRM